MNRSLKQIYITIGDLYPATLARWSDCMTRSRHSRVRVPRVAGGGASSPAVVEGGARTPQERVAGDRAGVGGGGEERERLAYER